MGINEILHVGDRGAEDTSNQTSAGHVWGRKDHSAMSNSSSHNAHDLNTHQNTQYTCQLSYLNTRQNNSLASHFILYQHKASLEIGWFYIPHGNWCSVPLGPSLLRCHRNPRETDQVAGHEPLRRSPGTGEGLRPLGLERNRGRARCCGARAYTG